MWAIWSRCVMRSGATLTYDWVFDPAGPYRCPLPVAVAEYIRFQLRSTVTGAERQREEQG